MFLGVFGRSGAWALPRPFQFDSEIGAQCHRLLFDAHRGEVGNRCFQDGIASCYVIGHRAEAAEQSSHYYFESRKGFGGNGELTELKKREVNDRRSPPRNNFIAQSPQPRASVFGFFFFFPFVSETENGESGPIIKRGPLDRLGLMEKR